MAFTDQATLAENTVFRTKVRVALATAAKDVMGEAKASMSDTEFGKRQALAFEVLRAAASGMYLEAFVWAVVANPVITDQSPDDAIQFTVNSSWGDLAGVRNSE